MFRHEADILRNIFGRQLEAVYHIGSTAVPGLKAKPIIDIMLVVKDIGFIDRLNHSMTKIGYQPKGENGIPGRRYFEKGGDGRTHHVHVFQGGDFHVERHLAVRDYLRTHPDAAREYGELKERLAQQFPWDIEQYILGKEPFVEQLEKCALWWYRQRY